jgi:tripartite-type tricarboxylate transporter receptor subunit TctC
LAAFALVLTGTNLQAQDFPARSIRIVVPYAAGGPSDVGARMMACLVPGAWGLVGTEAFLSAEPNPPNADE